MNFRNTLNVKVYRKPQEAKKRSEAKYPWMSGASNVFPQGNWAKVLPVWRLHRGRNTTGLQTVPTLLRSNMDMLLIVDSWAPRSLNSMECCEFSHSTQVANGGRVHSFGMDYSKQRAAGP